MKKLSREDRFDLELKLISEIAILIKKNKIDLVILNEAPLLLAHNIIKTELFKTGYLLCDDTLLNKQYSRVNELAKKQYSGNEHGLVNGICLVNLLWTSEDEFIPVDYRIYRKKADDKTKNDHFQDMLKRAFDRGFFPLYVLIDSWYSSISNLKLVRKFNWNFICSLKSNRKINVIQGNYIPIADLDLAETSEESLA